MQDYNSVSGLSDLDKLKIKGGAGELIVKNVDKLKIKDEMERVRVSNVHTPPSEDKNSIKLVVFNVERGRHIDEIEEYLKYHPTLKDADILFLNELDDGMARTNNIDITAEFAKRLSMNYIYGTEFYEMSKGNLQEEADTAGKKNARGFHGNAILSRYELFDPILIRLPVAYNWFYDKQKRLGGRMALFTKVRIKNQVIGLVCTHLENSTTPQGREEQMKFILKYVQEHFKEIPVVIAGDMNTNTCENKAEEFINMYNNRHSQTDRLYTPEKYEPVLQLIEDEGFNYNNANVRGKITRRKPLKGNAKLELNLDWFFVRGLRCIDPAVVSTIYTRDELEGMSPADTDAIDKEGLEISDHNAISVKCMF